MAMSDGRAIENVVCNPCLSLQCQFSCQFKDIDTKHDLTSAPLSPQPSLPDQKPVSSNFSFITIDINVVWYLVWLYFTQL